MHVVRVLEYTKESLLELKAQLAAREKAERMAKVGGDDFGGFGGFGGGGKQPPDGEKKEGAEALGEEEGMEEPTVKGQEGGDGEEEVETPASAEGSLGSLEEGSARHLSSVERELAEEMKIRYLWTVESTCACAVRTCVCMYVCIMYVCVCTFVCTYIRMCALLLMWCVW